METTANRLKEAMNIRQLKAVDLHNATGINKSSISQYISGTVKPKQDRIYLLAKALNVDELWLMGHNVPIERRPSPPTPAPASTDSEYIEKYKALNPAHKDAVNNQIDYFTGIE